VNPSRLKVNESLTNSPEDSSFVPHREEEDSDYKSFHPRKKKYTSRISQSKLFRDGLSVSYELTCLSCSQFLALISMKRKRGISTWLDIWTSGK
jgi:hypothetical protein